MEIRNILMLLIKNIHTTIDELYDSGNCSCKAENADSSDNKPDNHSLNDFQLGQAYAYVECLEILQSCEQLSALGLDYNIESRYPLV